MEKIKSLAATIWGERYKILRFLISGGTATGADFFFLYAFTEWVGLYYLGSAVLAFLIAVFISFVLQKFWTFQDLSKDRIHHQAVTYFIIATLNLGVNTGLVYLLVEYAGFHYLLGQFFSSGLIAVENFFIYHFFIFKNE